MCMLDCWGCTFKLSQYIDPSLVREEGVEGVETMMLVLDKSFGLGLLKSIQFSF